MRYYLCEILPSLVIFQAEESKCGVLNMVYQYLLPCTNTVLTFDWQPCPPQISPWQVLGHYFVAALTSVRHLNSEWHPLAVSVHRSKVKLGNRNTIYDFTIEQTFVMRNTHFHSLIDVWVLIINTTQKINVTCSINIGTLYFPNKFMKHDKKEIKVNTIAEVCSSNAVVFTMRPSSLLLRFAWSSLLCRSNNSWLWSNCNWPRKIFTSSAGGTPKQKSM